MDKHEKCGVSYRDQEVQWSEEEDGDSEQGEHGRHLWDLLFQILEVHEADINVIYFSRGYEKNQIQPLASINPFSV